MSRVLCEAVIQALKEAHEAWLDQHMEKYRESLKVAECAIEAISSLGIGDAYGREMELMGLQAEMMLLRSLAGIHCPEKTIPRYESAALLMLMPPSRVIPGDAPLLPQCEGTLDFFGGPSDETADSLESAMRLYSRLTGGGGGGVSEIYRAQLADYKGNRAEAGHWAKQALERMCGDRWIEPIAKKILSEKTDRSIYTEKARAGYEEAIK